MSITVTVFAEGSANITRITWLNPDGTSQQNGLTYNAANGTYSGNKALYMNETLALPIMDGAEWSLKIDLASYTSGQIVAFNPENLYSRIYLGTSATSTGRNDVRLGFTFDWTDISNSSGMKYYNFTWKGIKENIWDGNTHTLQLNYIGGKLTLTVDNANTYSINSIVVGNSAEILCDDTDGRISQVVIDLIKSQTGSEYFVLNGGGNPSASLGFLGSFSGITATIKGSGYATNPTAVVSGKNIHFLGSSVFYGSTGQPKGNSFVDFLARKWNVTTFQKQAVGGTTLSIRDGVTNSYCERYANFTDKDKCDALVVQLSTNDFNIANGTDAPVGSVIQGVYDAKSFDKTTVCGAIEWLIATAKENNPEVKVVFVSCPMMTSWAYYDDYKAFADNQMQTIIKKWGIYYADTMNNVYPWSGSSTYWSLNKTAPTSSTYHLFYNESHPNNVGYSLLMAPPVAKTLIDIFNSDEPEYKEPNTTSTVAVVNGNIVIDSHISDSSDEYVLFVALYDASDSLCGYITIPNERKLNDVFIVYPDNRNAISAKIFTWSSTDVLTPVADCETVSITR